MSGYGRGLHLIEDDLAAAFAYDPHFAAVGLTQQLVDDALDGLAACLDAHWEFDLWLAAHPSPPEPA